MKLVSENIFFREDLFLCNFLRSSGGRPDSRPDFRRPALAERGFDRGSVSDVGVGHENSGDDGGEEGFFEIPSGFPSLMSLGSGFESMKIR